MKKLSYYAIGLMSGTSLDGLDIAYCEFTHAGGKWQYRVIRAETKEYSSEWKQRLSKLHLADAQTFWKTHIDYGHFLGRTVNAFISGTNDKPQLISSHGHTIFHQPGQGFTMQAGAGEAIAAETGLPVVSDFRAADVALGGEGAPLVPMGDRHLFSEYRACLNIGGFTNVSMESGGKRIAFDICPSNIILNRLASLMGHSFDKDGEMARQGMLDEHLLLDLNNLSYYSEKPPKSLGREWLEEVFLPILTGGHTTTPDLLHTCCEHIGQQTGLSLQSLAKGEILVTGGGARNTFLLETISKHTHHNLVVPDELTVDFKEAIIFAFLGVLRFTGRENVLSSVTGAKRDHSGGSLFDLFPA